MPFQKDPKIQRIREQRGLFPHTLQSWSEQRRVALLYTGIRVLMFLPFGYSGNPPEGAGSPVPGQRQVLGSLAGVRENRSRAPISF